MFADTIQEIANHPESEPDDSLVLSDALAPDRLSVAANANCPSPT